MSFSVLYKTCTPYGVLLKVSTHTHTLHTHYTHHTHTTHTTHTHYTHYTHHTHTHTLHTHTCTHLHTHISVHTGLCSFMLFHAGSKIILRSCLKKYGFKHSKFQSLEEEVPSDSTPETIKLYKTYINCSVT